MAIDQATQQFLAQAQAANPDARPMHESTPEEARIGALGTLDLIGPGVEMAEVENLELSSGAGQEPFQIRVLKPSAQPQGIIVYLHGGGWVVSDIAAYDTIGRQLAQHTDHTVVLVNYRKAPEHAYPAPADDCWTALQWADENRAQLAAAGAPLVIAGDSAGGNLAAAMTLRAREAEGPQIDYQVLVYPVTDADFTRPSYLDPENQLMLTTESMEWFWNHYVPAERRTEQDVAPLHAESLADLPEAFVILAEHDVLRDEGEAYAARLAEDGVTVETELFEGQMHGFLNMFNILPSSAAVVERMGEKIRQQVAKEVVR
ncbi:alpha/beta hydrolase [Corynebacterium sp. YIM 101645]|uniref:Alpha/beta hydrolase n=1 Tax=Corynebacterium lemuris TaxID=1859292 RepID=A0ABT2G0F1_9CORY|nr:alpha/beta hydrolase [Corynebacterium lemuris]MCS5480881.1 alpha/beta hydrolase [Corynebacterium lemuris]